MHPEFPSNFPLKVGLVSLGCPKNLVDSEVLLGRLGRENVVLSRVEDADIAIVNTCCFVEDARKESAEAIESLLERKREGRLKGVIVTGCFAQRSAQELRERYRELDAVVGITAEREIGRLLRDLRERRAGPETFARAGPAGLPGSGAAAPPAPPARVLVREPSRRLGAEVGRLRLTPRHYAYLRIAEGCDHECTFCAIPGFRGRFRSKPEAAVLQEARELARDGAKELILIAEDSNQYGQDLRDGSSLARLLERLGEIEGVRWIRILYAFPAYFSRELMRAVAELPKVLKYIDMPLQHISDSVLRRMKRPPKAQTVRLLERLRTEIPGLALRTTVLSGFPGETEKDHEELLRFVREFRFERLGAFAYSEEEGTPAALDPAKVPRRTRERRRGEIMRAQQEIAFELNRARVGTLTEVLVDEVDAGGAAIGRTREDAPEIDGVIRIPHAGKTVRPGDLIEARVCRAAGYDLEGVVERGGTAGGRGAGSGKGRAHRASGAGGEVA